MSKDKTRQRVSTGNRFEIAAGYSRATRVEDQVFVSGTTALTADGEIVGGNDPYLQTKQTLETIRWALKQCGATMDDIVRYRCYVVRNDDIPEIVRALAEVFQPIRPSNTLVTVAALATPEMLIEIDADAIIGSASPIQE